MIKLKDKLSNFLYNILKKNDAESKFMLGSIYFNEAKKNYNSVKNLDETNYKVFSQTGEDGIINFLFYKLKISNCRFVEIGVGDYSEANTRFIYEGSFSKGLIIDVEKDFIKKVSKNINLWKGLINLENLKIDKENINTILKKYQLDEKLDLFSIDIDGNDYWIIEQLNKKMSKIFVLEYNPTFGDKLAITVPYDKNFSRFKEHYSGCYYGASLKAMKNIMEAKGYVFIGTNNYNFNAFFVLEEYSEHFKEITPNIKNLSEYTSLKIRDSRDKYGNLNFLNQNQRLKLIADKEIIDVSSSENKKYTIKELLEDI